MSNILEKISQNKKRFFFSATLYFSLLITGGCCLFPAPTPRRQKKVEMKVTAYCSCAKCTGWTRTCWNCFLFPVYAYGPNQGKPKAVGITSDGTKATHGTIAADLKYYAYGTVMTIPGYGTGVVHDTGSAVKGPYHIDVFFDDHEEALAWGVRQLPVTISYY